jgi:eukaryotic-like serine/threonine-protein kinase
VRRRLGQRYEIGEAIGSGATSTVHVGQLLGTAGFTKVIAIKRLHPHLASDEALRTILVDEARLVSRISHPNVVGVLDVAEDQGELFLVLEYARGATLAELLREGRPEPALSVRVISDALAGLHAAHHARDGRGEPLGLVHRDVTPRNVVATTDGIGKILDFGIAKARARLSTTREGHVRGSVPYMAPEQVRDEPLSARTDVYGASVVLWEALTGRRLFEGETEAAILQKILDHDVVAPSTVSPELPQALDAVVLRGLASDPEQRFASGLEMALALEASFTPASSAAVAAWVAAHKEPELAGREERLLERAPGERAPASGSTPRAAPGRAAAPDPAILPPRAPRRRVAQSLVLGAVVLAVGAGAAAALRAPGGLPPGVAGPGSARAPSAHSAPPAASHADETAPTAEHEPPPAAEAKPAVTVRAERPRRAAVPAPPAAPAPAKPSDCPPYHVDDAGVRRFNRECLK